MRLPPPRSEREPRALLRGVLGIAQMAGAVTALVLLARSGISAAALAAVAVTSLLTTTSVLLYGSQPRR